jgi:hypothetical protein
MSRSSSQSSVHNEPFAFPVHTPSNISASGSVNDSSSTFAQSLLSARRPSWTPSLSFRDVTSEGTSTLGICDETLPSQPSSPEDGGNFRRSLQIDNKGLVGDAVGNVSVCCICFGAPLWCMHYELWSSGNLPFMGMRCLDLPEVVELFYQNTSVTMGQ